MGYIRHHGFIVTGWNVDILLEVKKKADNLFEGLVSDITERQVNCYRSFFIAPDGSKEGWDTSDYYDEQRKKFKNILESYRYEDGSSPLSWVEVQYGDDCYETKIISDSDEKVRKEKNRDEINNR